MKHLLFISAVAELAEAHVSFKRTGTNRQTYIPNLLKK